MKKIIYCLLFTLILVVTGCSNSKLKSLSLDELYNKISNKDSFVVYFEVEENSLKTKLEKVLTNNDLTGYVVDTSKINDDAKIKLQSTIDYESSAIIFIIDEKDPSILSHITNSDTTLKEIEARLEDMNFIKK